MNELIHLGYNQYLKYMFWIDDLETLRNAIPFQGINKTPNVI